MKTKYFILVLVTIGLMACNPKSKQIETHSQKIEGTITLPDSLDIYNPFNENNTNNAATTGSTLKIYTFVDTSCPSCLSNINNWNKIALELRKHQVPIVMICQSEDNFELLKYLCEKKDIAGYPHAFYLDIKDQFFTKNEFLKPLPNMHTVLTDSNNKILLSGDLTLSEEVKQQYIDVIKSFEK